MAIKMACAVVYVATFAVLWVVCLFKHCKTLKEAYERMVAEDGRNQVHD